MDSVSAAVARDYIFRFDRPLDPLLFGSEFSLPGWLLHREGKPIHGLRTVVRRKFSRSRIYRGRRKRERPDVAAAFAAIAGASASGFLLEFQLQLGRSQLSFQLLDHERRWLTFATASTTAFPLALLNWSGFRHSRKFLLDSLAQRFAKKETARVRPARKASASPPLPQRVDLFATSKSNLFIVEIGQLVAAGFAELGCDAQLHLDQEPAENPPPETLQIVVTPHEFYNLFLSERVSTPRARDLTRNVHLLCTEQPETHWFESNLPWARYSLGVADINPLGVAAYRSRGLRAEPLQLGYHPMLAAPRRRSHAERRRDLVFLGSLTPRREEFLGRHADFFSRHECELRLVPLGFAKTKETRSYLTAERRNALLSDSRVLLNLHYSEQKYFEWHRMLLGLANGCCILTETCQGYGRLVPGRHFIMVETEDLIAACEYFLAHPAECEKIAEQGREFVETELRQSQACADFLGAFHATENESSLFDQPHDELAEPLPRQLSETIARRNRSRFFGALGRDLRGLTGRDETAPEVSAHILAPPLHERSSVIENREAYRTRLTQQQTARDRGEEVWRVHENEAFARSAAPELTVLITLYNYAQHIEECVASITAAAAELPSAPELVIVNDASTDDSLARALDCQKKSALPMRVVEKKFNTGLADARNVGIEFARAPYLFMMDADNLVFPAALHQLLAAIREENHDAAYSLLCRFRGEPNRRVGLLSYFDWDPQILLQLPYIDAMAMFRRDLLRELGGYDNQLSQIGWFGWEDYDLWLRLAQRGSRVAFVPNTLCLYRHHDSSMINTTNLFESELVAHFVQRYGEMLGRFPRSATVFGVAREKVDSLGEL